MSSEHKMPQAGDIWEWTGSIGTGMVLLLEPANVNSWHVYNLTKSMYERYSFDSELMPEWRFIA